MKRQKKIKIIEFVSKKQPNASNKLTQITSTEDENKHDKPPSMKRKRLKERDNTVSNTITRIMSSEREHPSKRAHQT